MGVRQQTIILQTTFYNEPFRRSSHFWVVILLEIELGHINSNIPMRHERDCNYDHAS